MMDKNEVAEELHWSTKRAIKPIYYVHKKRIRNSIIKNSQHNNEYEYYPMDHECRLFRQGILLYVCRKKVVSGDDHHDNGCSS
mmetsp:Transcript_24901/g.27845  ORF Transcript_24901/g.27845 Transcript_24901/m.27845 type:complete len:83 (-) Transcript_24901:51-299(-)